MEKTNQKELENLKNFNIEYLLKKDLYVDILIDDKWHQGYIKEEKNNNKYDILYLSLPNILLSKINITRKGLSFFGENYCTNNNNMREIILNQNFNELNVNNACDLLLNRLTEININYNDINNNVLEFEKNNKYNNNIFENIGNIFGKENTSFIIKDDYNNEFNLTGFYTYQFFSGIFIDIISFVNQTMEKVRLLSTQQNCNLFIDEEFENLLKIILNIIIFTLILGNNNLSNIKNNIQFNRKKILINKIFSIVASIESIISNIFLIFCYEYYNHPIIESKLKSICSLVYEIILNSGKDINNILPIQFLLTLINFILYEDNVIRIDNFDKNKIYKIFLLTLQNINGEEIKNIKNFTHIKLYCKTIINKLYKEEKKVLINNCYYSFLINGLTKTNILEKKIMALNCINDIIIDLLDTEDEINLIFFDFFINRHKITDTFFQETVHDEILKRSAELFKYLSFYDKLSDEIINKLIKLNNNTTIRNILCEIIKNLHNDKKNNLFKKITKDYNFDNNDNRNNIIEFISKLTLACFSSMENANIDLENAITYEDNNASNSSYFYNKNIINNNFNDRKRISMNIQILKMEFLKTKNTKNISRNVSSNSLGKANIDNNSRNNENTKRIKKTRKKLKKNYFGLDLLFNYIIYNYNEFKATINITNISKAIKSFKYILDSTGIITIKDIYYFLDKLLENICSNKKHNSVVQSLILIDILLNKLLQLNVEKNETYEMAHKNSKINLNELNINEEEGEIISELNNKYDIITLITNDLIRYVSKVHDNKNIKLNDNYKNEIFEGIYPYMKNISIRLKLLFFFVNFGIQISEEGHISKIYFLFKDDKFKSERYLFFKEISNNIYFINNKTRKNIFFKIFQNNTQFDISSFDDEDTFNLIKRLFIYINIYKQSLVDDGKTKKVNQDLNNLEGINFLFDILITNKNHIIQNKLCKKLSHYCLYLTNYKKEFSTQYWNNFINKITELMEKCHKNRNINGIFGLIQLIEIIYSYNFSWKIPSKEETHMAEEPYVLFHFCCPQRDNKIYKLRVGQVDKILHMRWKLAYFFDICVNDLVICDLDKKEYNFTYDNVLFYELFPPKKYIMSEIKYKLINVYEYPDQLLKIPNNPKELIEKNDKIINILIENLNNKNNNSDNNDFLMKKKIWNIMQKLPKHKYIEKTIKHFGESNKIENEELLKMFNVNEIFILTFNLQCTLNFLYDEKEQDKNNGTAKIKEINNFLDIFINFQHIDRILYNNLINIDIDNISNDNNTKFIYFECLKSLLELIHLIEEYKTKKTIKFIYFFNNNRDKDKETVQTKNELTDKYNEEELDSNQNNNSDIFKDTILEVIGYKQLYNQLTNIINIVLNDNNNSNELICSNLLKELIKFIDQINNKNSNNAKNVPYPNYFDYLFENEELFKKIYIYDFIKSSKEEVKKLLSNFLLQNLFDNYLIIKKKSKSRDRNDIIKKKQNKKCVKNYFEILLTPEMFDYLFNNLKNGSYFNLISSIIDKYMIYNSKINRNLDDMESFLDNNDYIDNYKKIIDLIIQNIIHKVNNNITINETNNDKQSLLIYPYNNLTSSVSSKKKNSNIEFDSLINGILLFLLRLLELSSRSSNAVIEYFLSKIDICQTFLLKGILNKCNDNNLSKKNNLFDNINSYRIIVQIIVYILKYLDNNKKNIEDNNYLEDCLYMKIWKTLNIYHKLSFWKKNKNYKIDYNDINKKEFVGLKNMSSTCYMNSILQQFFMIPMLRETILSIGNEEQINLKGNTILYQLQLLFASLKAYDFKYYDPKDFVIVSKLSFYEQMDADEYYCQLIDKLENDISNLYKKDSNNNNYKDLFKYFFGIKLTDELFFVECDHKRFNESFCYNVQLEVKNYTNIYDSLKNYFKIEIMTGDNKINCEECNIKRVCHKQLKIKNLPNILLISLKRFDYDYKTMTKFKLNSYFEFPFELDMSEFMLNKKKDNTNDIETTEANEEDYLYDLTGITIHYGVSDYGHYYDLIKAANNKWYMFNDINIKEFSEKDIPKEAFGERDNDNDLDKDSDKSGIKQQDKKNAYILIYTKKNYNENLMKNNEYNTKLIFPPYDTLSNINDNIKSYINYKMFKYWTIENLSNSFYQNFIIELLKIDLVKNIHQEINKQQNTLIEELKNGGYLPIKNYINTGNTIFSFGLLYFCNIMLRVKEKNNIHLFIDILTVYLENDIHKCLYLLEEFSNAEILDDFFVSCSNFEVIKIISELISISFKNYLSKSELENDSEHKNLNLFKFLNCIILFISNKASGDVSSLDNIIMLFYKLINKKPIFLKYLKIKGIEKWLDEIINKINNSKSETGTIEINANNDEEERSNINILLTESNFPKLECDHYILGEKASDLNHAINNNNTIDKNIKKKTNSKKGKNESINSHDSIILLRRLQDDIRDIVL